MKKLDEADKRIHAQFSYYGKNAKEWLRKCALLLPHIERRRIWEKKGFSSIHEYAAKLAGMSHWSVHDALRVLRKIEDKPELQKVVSIFGIQRVRPVASIATPKTAKFWAEKAMDMSKHALEIYVHDFQMTFGPGTKGHPAQLPERAQEVTMRLESEVFQKLLKLKGKNSWNELMEMMLREREEKLEQEKPEAAKTNSRHIPKPIEKYVITKTNGQCAFPSCTKPYTNLHHTQRFSLEKIHDPDRLVPFCTEHERIAHLGLIENEEAMPAQWKLRTEADKHHIKKSVDDLVNVYR